MEEQLSLEFLRVVENGAVAAARTMGFGDRHKADEVAVEAMRKAADEQDKLGQREVDIPAREMLGDLLLLENNPQAALLEYRTALKLSPNRLNGLLSAGAAAEATGNTALARSYYEQVARNTDGGVNTSRPAVAYAVKFGVDHPEVAAK